jgi:hypothetical protein
MYIILTILETMWYSFNNPSKKIDKTCDHIVLHYNDIWKIRKISQIMNYVLTYVHLGFR